ncbi:MAG: NAD(P)-dependent oxidoreductase [Planctomycetota bacterium]|jgi:D-3-phosphoglycerate dehydrogenase
MKEEYKGKYKVLAMPDISHMPNVYDDLKTIADVDVVEPSREYLLENIHKYDAYIATLNIRFDKEIIDRAEKLKVIASSATGQDHMEGPYAEAKGIKLITLKYDTEFLSKIACTAEMGWGLLLSVIRQMPQSFEAVKRGEWARDKYRGHQLYGKTLGILGYGRLGKIMAKFGMGFNMRVIANDIKDDIEYADYVEPVDLDTLLKESDIFSIHIHLTEENTKFIKKEHFQKMKKECYLINTARGAIIDEDDFLEALETGEIAGAGVDVIHGEWMEDIGTHPLIEYARNNQNLVISPHTGGVTYESQSMALKHTADKLQKFLEEL